jgi:peptidyl-prolyl cis-trans isomerase SurA
MKKILILIAGLHFCFAYAQQNEDPTVMTVAGTEVPLSEFLFLAQKDSEVNLLDKKSLENYVELFKNFKLKVADARSLRIQESLRFQEELASYRAQLMSSYLSDMEGEEQAMRKVYERGKEVLILSHIMFQLPEQSLPKDTLEVFNKANALYKRIVAGEDFATLGQALDADENSEAIYEEIDYMFPLQAFKSFEDVAYSMSEGEISVPVRTLLGFHIIQLKRRIAQPGSLQVAHILIQSPEYAPEDDATLLKKANEVYAKVKAGEDFEELVQTYSADENTRDNGGRLPYFSLGNMVLPFEQAAFSLQNVGDISEPVQTRLGYHIIKLLDKKGYQTFEEMAQSIYNAMTQGEWAHELSRSFEERQKAKLNFTFYQEAYDELIKLCADYFPTDTSTFYNRASTMTKPIMRMSDEDFPQYEFAEYVRLKPLSKQTFSEDYLNEMFIFFVREIVTALERMDLEERNPEFRKLMNEYYDGILLFEISSDRVWNRPVEEQAKFEQEWMKELNEKYKVEINWSVLNNLKNYINQ